MHQVEILFLFVCLLLCSPETGYFFTDDIANIGFDCIKHSLKAPHNSTDEQGSNRLLKFLFISPENSSLTILHWKRSRFDVIREMSSHNFQYFGKYSHEKFIKDVCCILKNQTEEVGSEIYFFVDMSIKDKISNIVAVDEFTSKFRQIVQDKLSQVNILKGLTGADELANLIQEQFKERDENKDLDRRIRLPFFDESFDKLLKENHVIRNFENNLAVFEGRHMSRLAEEYKYLVKHTSSRDIVEVNNLKRFYDSSIITRENEDRFFYLYIFEMLKSNNLYSKEIIKKRRHFFIKLLRFITIKNYFLNHFTAIYYRCEDTEKKELESSLARLPRPDTMTYVEEPLFEMNNIPFIIYKYCEHLYENSDSDFIPEFASKFLTILLRDFHELAEISLSNDHILVENCKRCLRDDLKEKEIRCIKYFLKGIDNIASGISDINDFSSYDQEIILKLQPEFHKNINKNGNDSLPSDECRLGPSDYNQ